MHCSSPLVQSTEGIEIAQTICAANLAEARTYRLSFTPPTCRGSGCADKLNPKLDPDPPTNIEKEPDQWFPVMTQ